MGKVNTDILRVSLTSWVPSKYTAIKAAERRRTLQSLVICTSRWLRASVSVSYAASLCSFEVPCVAWDSWQRLGSCARVLPSPDTWHCYLIWALPAPQHSTMEQVWVSYSLSPPPNPLRWGWEAFLISRFSRSTCCLPQILSSSVSVSLWN